MMNNILVLFTGGTIGCAPVNQDGILNVDEQDSKNKSWKDYYLITYFNQNTKSHNKSLINFHTMAGLQILSENMQIDRWNELINLFKKIDFSLYDGIIVTHGSDTLAYSSSFFGILLSGIKIPIVFIGSNLNLHHPNTSGHVTFENAVDFICNYKIPGIFVLFGYNQKGSHVYLSTRIKQSEAFIDKYESINGIDFGYVEDGLFIPNINKTNPSMEELHNINKSIILYDFNGISNHILLIYPYVGLNYDSIELNEKEIKSVIHTTYHSFTNCVDDEESKYSILYFYKKCLSKGISLYITPFPKDTDDNSSFNKYISIDKVMNYGIKTIVNTSLETSYAKLLIALNMYQDSKKVDIFLKTNIFHEVI